MEKTHVVGIDLGGTNTVFGVVDARGEIFAREKFKTAAFADSAEAFFDYLSQEVLAMIARLSLQNQIKGIGIGAPSGNYYTGTIDLAVNLPWKDPLPIAEKLAYRTGIPAVLTNDANAAAIGEMTYGAAKGMKNFYLITLGTGIGSGIIVNGSLLYGNDGKAGELGHVIVRRNGRPCGCGRCGCLETYCSATGVVHSVLEFLSANPSVDSLLRKIPEASITSQKVFEAASAGDTIACDIFDFTGTILGESLADFATFSSPEAIILFGGLTNAGELLMSPLRRAFDANMLKAICKPEILLSKIPETDAAILGAAALGWEAREVKAVD